MSDRDETAEPEAGHVDECPDCGRRTVYGPDERYHHAEQPERGCFLIAAETPADRVAATLVTVWEFDANEFERLLKGLAPVATEAADARPEDPAWRNASVYLNWAADAVSGRRGN